MKRRGRKRYLPLLICLCILLMQAAPLGKGFAFPSYAWTAEDQQMADDYHNTTAVGEGLELVTHQTFSPEYDLLKETCAAMGASIVMSCHVNVYSGALPAQVTIYNPSIQGGNLVIMVLHEDNVWRMVRPSAVGSGYITATFNYLCPIAVVRLGSGGVSPTKKTETPPAESTITDGAGADAAQAAPKAELTEEEKAKLKQQEEEKAKAREEAKKKVSPYTDSNIFLEEFVLAAAALFGGFIICLIYAAKAGEGSKKRYKWAAAGFAAVLIAGAALWGSYYNHVKQEEQLQLELQRQEEQRIAEEKALLEKQEAERIAREEEEARIAAEEAKIHIPEKNLNWEEIKETNKDIYAWVYVPGTSVDYPILQHETDDTYYMNHNIDGSKGKPGCLFTEKEYNKTDFSDICTVIYGHNMSDKAMFGSLHDLEDEAVFNETPYIFVYTPDGNYCYKIFGAFAFSDERIPYVYDFSTLNGYALYRRAFNEAIADEHAHVRSEIIDAWDREDKTLTLSTCIDNKKNKRYLVQAVLAAEEEIYHGF